MYINWPAVSATILPNVGGWAGSIITKSNLQWYETLHKPDWRPPNWAFAPVWTGLYCSMGYASYLVFRDGGGLSGSAKLPLLMYGGNLALNWAWTPIFFGAHKMKLAFYEINLLLLSTIGTGVLFYKVNKVAGLLFIPYAAWMGLATFLNYKVCKSNEAKVTEIKNN